MDKLSILRLKLDSDKQRHIRRMELSFIPQRGSTSLLSILLLFSAILTLMVLPITQFATMLRTNRQLQQVEVVNRVTCEVQEQASVYLEEFFLSRIGSHFQSQLEQMAANDLRDALDPLPQVQMRRTFFNRAFLIPHINTWLGQDAGVEQDQRFNTVRSYLSSLGSISLLITKYAGEVPGSSPPVYIIDCEVYVVSQDQGENLLGTIIRKERIAHFPLRFSPTILQQDENPSELDLPGIVLYPYYQLP